MDYGGGVTTYIGHGSVGTPGGLAAYARASQRLGKLPWRELFAPAIQIARDGFAMSPASHQYLQHVHHSIYGWQPQSRAPLHNQHDQLKSVGERVVIAHLADSLEAIARDGAETFYQGDLATLIAREFAAHEGPFSGADLAAYEVFERTPLEIKLNDWHLATNPAPAVGGATLIAMLELLKQQQVTHPPNSPAAAVAALTEIQQRVLMYRFRHLDYSENVDRDVATLLQQAQQQSLALSGASASTVHTSATDQAGLCCAITMSSGYGSGVMPQGTGIWMNNCLGEIELNRKGLNAGPAGMRLASNMAPTVGRHRDGHALTIGSPGADRITSALLCTLKHFALGDRSLDQAIAAPRLHVDINNGDPRLMHEPGLDVSQVALACRAYPPTRGVLVVGWFGSDHRVSS